MELIFPAIAHKQAALDFVQEHISHGERSIHGGGGISKAESYEQWLDKLHADLTCEVSEERVPSSTYFGMADGRIVGVVNIRHPLNAFLRQTYGHIGYGVRPSERGKGYGTEMLALALEKCRALGLDRVMISCDLDNPASAGVILKNGGVYDREFTESCGTVVRQYWIAL